jgi:hypothetical protein
LTTTEPAWRTSSRCGNNTCVSVATHAAGMLVRDSKLDDSPILAFNTDDWNAFLTGIRAGEFDRR